MKKVALSLIALLAIGSFASAQATVTGSADVKAAVDLNSYVLQFTNTNSYTVVVPFTGGAGAKAGTGAVYGSIDIAGASLGLQNKDAVNTLTGDAGTVTAKIVAGDLSVSFASAPSFKSDYAAAYAPFNKNSDDPTGTFVVNADATLSGGVAVSYKLGDFGSVTLNVATEKTQDAVVGHTAGYTIGSVYIAKGDETSGAYVLKTTFDASASNATILANLIEPAAAGDLTADLLYYPVTSYDAVDAAAAIDGGKVVAGLAANLVLVKDILTLGLNSVYDASSELAGGSIKVGLTPIKPLAFNASADATYKASTLKYDVAGTLSFDIGMGLTVAAGGFYQPKAVNALTSDVVEANGSLAGALVIPGLNFKVYGKTYDYTDMAQTYAGLSVDYTVGAFKPYALFDVGLSKTDVVGKVGVDTSIVENTLISAYWKGGSVTEDANIYSGAYTGLASGKLGSFTVECKVTL